MRVFAVTQHDIDQCPERQLAPAHYREDGTCLHRSSRATDAFKFDSIPLDEIEAAAIPPDPEQHPEWLAEHQDAYTEHGGSQAYIEHLAQDMREHGQDEAVELDAHPSGPYTVRDGNHRIAALRRAGISHAKAVVYRDEGVES